MFYLKLISKTILATSIIMLCFIGCVALVDYSFTKLVTLLGVEQDFKVASIIATIAIIFKFRKHLLRYPFSITFEAKRIINAPSNVVWSQIYPRERGNYFNVLTSSIEDLGDNIFRFHSADTNSEVSDELDYFDMKLIRQDEGHFIEYEILHEDKSMDAVKTARGYLLTIKKLPDGRSEVSSFEMHQNPSVFTILVYFFIGAPKDVLRQLASACEGRPNISWATSSSARHEIIETSGLSFVDYLKAIEEQITISVTALISISLFLMFYFSH